MINPTLNTFLDLSEQLCGITRFDLEGTGYSEKYLKVVEDVVTKPRLLRLLDVARHIFEKFSPKNPEDRDKIKYRMVTEILENPEFGPIARNIQKLWFAATWFQMPDSWWATYGEGRSPVKDFIPDPYAYPESLLGPATGSHPAGAKPTGHQSWQYPPVYLPIPENCI